MCSDDMTIWKDDVSEVYTSCIIYSLSLLSLLFFKFMNVETIIKASGRFSYCPDTSIFENADVQNQLAFLWNRLRRRVHFSWCIISLSCA